MTNLLSQIDVIISIKSNTADELIPERTKRCVRDETMPYLHWQHSLRASRATGDVAEQLRGFSLRELEREVARRRARADEPALTEHLRTSHERLRALDRRCPIDAARAPPGRGAREGERSQARGSVEGETTRVAVEPKGASR